MTDAAPATNEAKKAPITHGSSAQPAKDDKPARAALGVTLWAPEKEGSPFTGYVEANGSKIPVSAFLNGPTSKDGVEHGPFMGVVQRLPKDAEGNYPKGENLGKLNAVNTEKGQPLAADRTPYLLGEVKVGDKPVMVRAYMKADAIEVMPKLGFNAEVVANFQAKVDADATAKKSAAPKP